MSSRLDNTQNTAKTRDFSGYVRPRRYKDIFFELEGPILNKGDIPEEDIITGEEELKRLLEL